MRLNKQLTGRSLKGQGLGPLVNTQFNTPFYVDASASIAEDKAETFRKISTNHTYFYSGSHRLQKHKKIMIFQYNYNP